MATYRVISVDLRTGARIAELNVTGLKYGHRLKGVGAVSGSVKLPAPVNAAARARGAVINDAVDECRRHLIVERDGVIVGDGIVWASPYRSASSTRELVCASTWSYFRRRHITARSVFAGVDQLTIAQSLLNAAQAAPGGNIGVTVGTETSGRVRDRTYERYELKEVGEAIEELAELEDGFDFDVDLSWEPATGALVKRFATGYKRRGRTFAQTGHVFELGRNVLELEWPSDGTTTANKTWAVGGGEGSAALLTSAVDAAQIQALTAGGPGYPLLEDVITNKDVTVLATLQSQARARVAARSRPVVVPKLRVRADRDPKIGSYITGDSCRVIVPPNTDARFPDGLDTFRRIIGWDVTVDEEGTERVDLLLGEEPVA